MDIAIKHAVDYKTLGNLAKGNHSLSAFKKQRGRTIAGTMKKDLPKRPVHLLKPKPAPVATSSAVRVEEPQEGSKEDDDEFEA